MCVSYSSYACKSLHLESRSTKCIVGSANLTAAALSEENASGQYEAAVDIGDTQKIRTVKRWFENLWNEAQPISQVDLRSAKAAWEKARSNRHGSSKKKSDSKASGEVDFPFPVDWTPHRDLVNLASKVRDWDYSKFNKYRSVLSRIVRHGREDDLKALILFVAEWTSHAGKYRPALEEPESRIRRAFKTLFDHSNSVEDRLRELDSGGTCKIKGFGLASLTMILHWRIPTEYPPFNRRTQRFLRDFGFGEFIPKTLSPVQYGKWIAFAQELSARLDLPSSGHVDRLVWEYTRELDIE